MDSTVRRFARAAVFSAWFVGSAMPAKAATPQAATTLPLKVAIDVPLGGKATRLDYESLDAGRHLLFIAHLGDSAVVVFDTLSQRVLARIPGISKVHGVLAVPELGRVYASATGTNEVVAIDQTTLKVTARLPGGIYPDGMAYAPDVHKLYVSDEHGGTDTVIDVNTNTRIATIPVGGDVGNTQYDPVSKHIFVNVQTRNDLVEIDPATDTVVRPIALPGANGNHGLLIDSAQRLAFIACERNNKLLVLNLDTQTVVAVFDVGADPDVLAYTPAFTRSMWPGKPASSPCSMPMAGLSRNAPRHSLAPMRTSSPWIPAPTRYSSRS